MPSGNKNVERYGQINIMTAGSLKSFQLLLERCLNLIDSYDFTDEETKVKILNILSQLQSSLNIRYPEAIKIFESIRILYDSVDLGDEEHLAKVRDTVAYFKETVEILQFHN